MIKLGERIKEFRQRNGRTQDALAEELGVTAQAVSRWEKGICYPDMEVIATNARVAQNQDEYSTAYDAAVGRYESTKAERDSVAAEIRQKGIRRR